MILYSNNASTTLASEISNSATTIVVATGTGSLFPTISSVDDYFNVTLTDSAKHIEIVTVTARTGDTFTVMRGMENTTARDWLASDILELRITKGLLDQLKLDATKDSALDALVVHNLGNETVQGTKTFSDGIITSELQLSGGTGVQGTVTWNTTDGTMDLRLTADTALQLGQEQHIYGKASGAIDNGKLCMFTGAEGDHITLKQIGAGDIATMQSNQHYFVGVATSAISNGGFGYATWFGKVNGVYTKAVNTGDTRDWVSGDILYFSNTTGQLTVTVPDAPGIFIEVAAVIKAATGKSENGIIMVRPSFGQMLSNLEDVDGVPINTTGQMLVWDNTSKVWSATQTTTTSVRATGTADDNHLPTEAAVRSAITSATPATGNLSETTSSVLTITGGTGSVIGSGTTIQVNQASGSVNGYLSSTDWTTFNNKQAALTFGTGVTTFLATPSSANLASAVTDETGSGSLVFGTSPALTTPTLTGFKETKVVVSAADIDLTAGNYFTKTLSTNTTFTVSNVPTTGTVAAFVLDLTNSGTYITWWSNIKWAGGTAPTLTTSGRDVLGFFTHDGGTTWNGFVLGKAMA